jgi:FkbM family methyltransferase
LAAGQRALATRVSFVEAEPQHAEFLREALQINNVHGDIVEAAISYSGEPVAFAVKWDERRAKNWYGQMVVSDELAETNETYLGKTIYRGKIFDQILVPSLRLEDVASDLGLIDFIDCDIQGSEREMVPNSIEFLTERVRRIHIGTHGPDIENILREVFLSAGWHSVWDFGTKGVRDTPYGPCEFDDGVQSWINPRFSVA